MAKFAAIRGVLLYTLALNLLVTAVKMAIGVVSGSLSVLADGFDSLLNSASNIVGLVGIAVAARPPDPGHPYGHRRFESLATAGISVLLFVTTAQLVQSAINRFRFPATPVVTLGTFAAPLVSIAVQTYVALYEYRRGRELKSQILIADALHTRADVLVSVSVVAGLIAVRLGLPAADPVLALLIAAFIAAIGFQIVRNSSRVLADTAVLDPARVEETARQVPGVQSVHRVRSRGQEDDIHLDLHVRVRPGMPVEQGHDIAHLVEARLRAEVSGLRDVVVHIEPQRSSMPADPTVEQRIRAIAQRIPGTAVHGIQAHEVAARLFITLDLEVDPALSLDQAHGLAHRLEEMLRAEIPGAAQVTVHVEPASQGVAQAAAVDEHSERR
ncbi:MAG TPA: cation-efflux pump [Anaerolineae bacterium]|nr:cation-efflux pump [Anaerolineae bacterium]HOR00124.1 cation-efflux pump [Anaerolineae bacterium]HPL28181.1 cation-efflux pump [Anaerolineae bacterium]